MSDKGMSKATTTEPKKIREHASGKLARWPAATGPHADILALQRAAGNWAVNQLLQSSSGSLGVIQPKLIVGQPGDRYEQEADRVAEQVMRMSEPHTQRRVDLEEEEDEVSQTKPLAGQITPLVQRQPIKKEEEEEEKELLLAEQNTGQNSEITPELESRIEVLKGGGQALDSGVRAQMEPAFGSDLSGIRVHTDAQADSLNRSLNARAFTTGRDIFFRQWAYDPSASSGLELLAHELTHVMQQAKGTALLSKREVLTPPGASRETELTPGERTSAIRGIVGSKTIKSIPFKRWLERRIQIMPRTKPETVETFTVSLRVETFQETSDTVTSEWSFGGEGGVGASYRGILTASLKGGYKYSQKTERKVTQRRDRKIVQKTIPIKALSRKIDAVEVSRSWYEYSAWMERKSRKGTKFSPVVERRDVEETIKGSANLNELGFEVEGPEKGQGRQFWPQYYYWGSIEAPIEEFEVGRREAIYEVVEYIHERGRKIAEYANMLFEAGL